MVFTQMYTSINGSLAFISIAIYILYMNGYQSPGESFSDALTATAYLAGLTSSVAALNSSFSTFLPTLGIFRRISNGLQKIKDVLNTYEQFDTLYASTRHRF